MENDHELLPVKLPDIIAGDPISFYMKVGNTKKEELIMNELNSFDKDQV